MKRKDFLALLPAAALINPLEAGARVEVAAKKVKIPPYLGPGDIIGITCPSGNISSEEIAPAVALMQQWGFRVKIGETVGARDFTFGGTDQQRIDDFQAMLYDVSVKAIMCARGGYGAVRIIDRINFKPYKAAPKWIIGFSDITIFHSHINTNFGIATLHSKMCNSFPDSWDAADELQRDTILSLKNALKGEQMRYSAPAHTANRYGEAEGVLIGGNLRCIENLAGSVSEIDTSGKILFVEDTGEALYSIDRMFCNLKRSGKLQKLKGLIVGGFKLKADDTPEEFGRTVSDIVLEKVSEYDYPVCFDFPVGHQKANYALKCGVKHQLIVQAQGSNLFEI